MAAKYADTEVGKPTDENEGEAVKKLRSAWPNLHQWVSCICVVTFDLELGQAIEVKSTDQSRQSTLITEWIFCIKIHYGGGGGTAMHMSGGSDCPLVECTSLPSAQAVFPEDYPLSSSEVCSGGNIVHVLECMQ